VLISAVKIAEDQPTSLKDLSADEALTLIKSENFTWIDIQISDQDERQINELLVDRLDFHPATVEDCLHPSSYHQPKIDEEQDYKFITFLYYEKQPSEKLVPHEINMYVSMTYVITVRRDPLPDFFASVTRLPRHITEYEMRAVLFLHHILDMIIDSFATHLTELQQRSEELEISVLKTKRVKMVSFRGFSRHRRQLSDMRQILRTRQNLVMLRRSLLGELTIIEQLMKEYDYEGAPEESEEIGIYFSDIADHVRKYLEIIESQDRTMNHLMEVHHLVTGHRTNEIIYLLTILSAIMLPLNLIVGFFGMNFDNLWFSHATWGLSAVTLAMVLLAVGLLAFFRSRGWI
jgi:magnesium transporter